MEISWEPALSEKTDEIIKNKMENEEEKQMTPWEKYQRQKVKRGKRKDQIKDRYLFFLSQLMPGQARC